MDFICGPLVTFRSSVKTRAAGIRTLGLHDPNVALYQAELRPEMLTIKYLRLLSHTES